jgi:hypothetical protein
MMTSKQRLWAVKVGRRSWIFTTRRLVWKAAVVSVCALCVLAVLYSIYLVITVRRSNQELARIASAENGYMERNWRELQRSKQILLFAGGSYAKRLGTHIDGSVSERDFRRMLREPYPDAGKVERLLGKADMKKLVAGLDHRIWQRTRWEKPAGWLSGGTVEKAWPCIVERLLEAWFDKDGYLERLICIRQDPGGIETTEQIGRQAGDWKIQRIEGAIH